MSDPYVELLRAYDRETAAAHEVIRRARARLHEGLVGLGADPPVEGESVTWAATALADEPNAPEMAVEAAIEQPGPGRSESEAPRAPASSEPVGKPTPAAAPTKRRKHAKETYLCTCGRPFVTKGWRDRHAASHRAQATGGKPVGQTRGREVDRVLHGAGGGASR